MVVNNPLERLKSLGFSEYEAKVYLALVRSSPVTAYEAAGEAGVPTSKVYEVLARLEEKGWVGGAEMGGRRRFVPHPPASLVRGLRDSLGQTLDGLEDDLARLSQGDSVSFLWNLQDEGDLLQKARDLIRGAQSTLLVSAWGTEMEILGTELEARARGGIRVACVHFGAAKPWGFQVFPHPIQDTIYGEKGGRGLTVIADSREALAATILENRRVEGAWSANHGFVTLAEDYVKHDIYIMKIVERFDRELLGRFGPGYTLLRDVFQDQEVRE